VELECCESLHHELETDGAEVIERLSCWKTISPLPANGSRLLQADENAISADNRPSSGRRRAQRRVARQNGAGAEAREEDSGRPGNAGRAAQEDFLDEAASVPEPSRNVDAALDEAAEQIGSLEAELDDAHREIGRLNAILAQSPARKAMPARELGSKCWRERKGSSWSILEASRARRRRLVSLRARAVSRPFIASFEHDVEDGQRPPALR